MASGGDECGATRGPAAAPDPTAEREREWAALFAHAAPDETGPLAPHVVASPVQMPGAPLDVVAWWRPGWRDTWRYVGWRWVFLSPALLLFLVLFLPLRWFNLPFYIVEIKLVVFVGAIALTLTSFVVRRAARARTEPFCIFCGYSLSGLPDHYRCPECGRPYTWRLIAEYRRDPEWFVQRWRERHRLPPAPVPFAAGPVRRRTRDGTS